MAIQKPAGAGAPPVYNPWQSSANLKSAAKAGFVQRHGAADPINRGAQTVRSSKPSAPPVYRPSAIGIAQGKMVASPPAVYRPVIQSRTAPPPVYTPYRAGVTQNKDARTFAPPVYRPANPDRPAAPPVYRPGPPSVTQGKGIGVSVAPPVYRPQLRPSAIATVQSKGSDCSCTSCKKTGSCKSRKSRHRLTKHPAIQACMAPGSVVQRSQSDDEVSDMDTGSDSDYEPSDDEGCDETNCVDENCDLKPAVGSVRAWFYPNGYRVATLLWKAGELTNLQDTCGGGNFRCPGCNNCRANGTATIDHHPEAVSQHWNRIGRTQDRDDRMDFYNDTTNMRILCGTCNQGGVPYDRDVTDTFSDNTNCH